LVVANPEAQGKLLGLLEPLLEMTAGIATLMIRYIKDSCCDDPDHMPNKTNPDFEKKLKDDLAAAASKQKSYLVSASHGHCRVINPAMDMANKATNEIWGDDPTMPTPQIFDSLVAAMAAAEVRAEFKIKRSGDAINPPAKRSKTDSNSQEGVGSCGQTGRPAAAGGNAKKTGGRDAPVKSVKNKKRGGYTKDHQSYEQDRGRSGSERRRDGGGVVGARHHRYGPGQDYYPRHDYYGYTDYNSRDNYNHQYWGGNHRSGQWRDGDGGGGGWRGSRGGGGGCQRGRGRGGWRGHHEKGPRY
jgi:hypothetical protein